jgi:hypothetical protein
MISLWSLIIIAVCLLFFFGPFSSLHDFLTYGIMLFIFGASASLFQSGWFVESRFVRDFAFVWVLLGLLGLYIVSIDRGSYILLASGNLVVEALLIAYTVRNRPSRAPRIEEVNSYSPQLK